MKNINSHNEPLSNDQEFLQSLPKVELPYSRSKEDVWQNMEAMMDNGKQSEETTTETKGKTINMRSWAMAAAAVIIFTLCTGTFFRLYTKTINAHAGQHLTALLPDGSSIELNAGSVIKYKPYWWRFEREVQFEGEAFFKVKKGESFEVVSSLGRTIVLGTSFNIYARKNDYKVTCYTGKVRVVSTSSGASTDITPNMQAVVNNGTVSSHNNVNTSETISWVNDMFIFTGTPIHMVFEEVERQYGISIKTTEHLDYLYSGNFTRDRSVDDVVNMICRSMGLDHKKVSNGYLISK
ncbi:FecR family protein [Carboxylicivirga sp. M1479]|uniref:FecR family protein n=1 Tax=Carboxylicivirga sp. M1479 TaxID=2594476 RepID=UPI0011786AD6|nr:FecR family protein [Carboxylicivirga sp. M1479]TRX71635.1 FecR family protein [Carboxylicivirga sp. M1479]